MDQEQEILVLPSSLLFVGNGTSLTVVFVRYRVYNFNPFMVYMKIYIIHYIIFFLTVEKLGSIHHNDGV